MSTSNPKDVPNVKEHAGKSGATAAAAKQLLDGDQSESVDDAIKKIKAMATERIRQRAAASRAAQDAESKASDSTVDKDFNMSNFPHVDKTTSDTIDILATSAANLTIEAELASKVKEKQDKENLDDTLEAPKSASVVEPTKPEIVDAQAAKLKDYKAAYLKASDVKTADVKSSDVKTADVKTSGVKAPDAKASNTISTATPKLGTIVVPKVRPKSSEPKLPQNEDGFSPQPWVKRRYTIAQLLLLGEIIPYVICPRDRFNIQIFSYDIVHIPGLGNESTGNAVVDHQILTLNLRTELVAFQFFTTYGYRYLERFKSPDHTLFVKGLWVEVRGSAGLRDHGGYRNAYRPKPYTACINEGLVKENQEAEVLAAEQQRFNHANSVATHFRGRGGRGGQRGGYRAGSARGGGHRTTFSTASTEQLLMMRDDKNIPVPALSLTPYTGPRTPIASNDAVAAMAQEAGTFRDLFENYADNQLVRNEIEHAAALGGNAAGDVVGLVEQELAEKKAEITNKWGEIYGYTVQEPKGELVSKPGGLQGNSSTPEQQMQYIQYMLQTPLAPVLSTTHAAGNLTPSAQLAQPSTPMSDNMEEM
ncbi:hypothetical protein Dda_1120 [Drechslerella dactyloides]|uniref:Uncharacterized protein n=1 Tax=Drechslerella dactyloides TaxID=74499 RepID=A0AAD6J6D8_DREDA|nr:hypothetical protein Dda_1120 [Drechslerella dactyloides]